MSFTEGNTRGTDPSSKGRWVFLCLGTVVASSILCKLNSRVAARVSLQIQKPVVYWNHSHFSGSASVFWSNLKAVFANAAVTVSNRENTNGRSFIKKMCKISTVFLNIYWLSLKCRIVLHQERLWWGGYNIEQQTEETTPRVFALRDTISAGLHIPLPAKIPGINVGALKST